ncbi:class I SAM-dependent methyltransferase [Patescibacteria group bacterium]|nr:class I SAM-dependent methyltransferase [Patescibacteria group bacterium]
MKCKICNKNNTRIFTSKILNKYEIDYFYCENCSFLQTENPYWIKESYRECINNTDTGILVRNIILSNIVSVLIYFFFNKNKKFLDYGGGYGIFTRLMRDIGINYYWQDKYSENLLAKGFEHNENERYELITSFEVFEHFVNPIEDIKCILQYSDSILFTTNILPLSIPKPSDWWYYGLDHGQHISFFSVKTLQFIADKYHLNLYTDKVSVHLLTKKKIDINVFNILVKLSKKGLLNFLKKAYKSKTWDDNELLKKVN